VCLGNTPYSRVYTILFFVKLALHFMTIVVNPIIYRLVPSPSLFEIMQWSILVPITFSHLLAGEALARESKGSGDIRFSCLRF